MDFPQCQPEVLGPQKIRAQSQNVPDPERIIELEQLLIDFRDIRQSLAAVKRVPSGFAKNCINQKKEMVMLHFSKLVPNQQKTHRVLKVMAQLLDNNFEYKDAVKFYEAAYQVNPADTESALRGFKMQADLDLQNFNAHKNSLTRDQKRATLMGLLKKAYEISENPKFSTDQRLWALEEVRGVLAVNEIRATEEEIYWRKFYALDSGSDLAMRELMNLYESRSDFGKMSLFATKLAYHPRALATDAEKIGLALLKAEDHASLLKAFLELNKKFPNDPEILGYLGIAEQRLKLYDKSATHLEKALALKSKNPQVAASYALLLEDLGDKAALSSNWVEAMSRYREALSHNPSSQKLKKKTANLILDYYAESKFPQNPSTKKDMDYALGLLKDALSSKVPLMADYATALRLAAHSTTPAKYTSICDRYRSDRPSGLSVEIVRSCVGIYRAAGSEAKAKSLVDFAADKAVEALTKQEILRTLR